MFYPKLRGAEASTTLISRFSGYDHTPNAGENAFYRMENMGPLAYPAICTRAGRWIGRQRWGDNIPVVGVCERDQAAIATADGTVHCGGYTLQGLLSAVEVPAQQTGQAPRKTMVSIGANVVVWPDKKWFNAVKLAAGETMTEGEDYGSLEASWQQGAEQAVEFAPCDKSGALYTGISVWTAEPESPENGALWIPKRTPYQLKKWVAENAMWVEVADVCTRIACAGIGADFREADGVTISGARYIWDKEAMTDSAMLLEPALEALNQDAVLIRSRTQDAIVVTGLMGLEYTQETYLEQLRRDARYLYNWLRLTQSSDAWLPQETYTAIDTMTQTELETLLTDYETRYEREFLVYSALRVARRVPQLDFVTECDNRLWGCFYGEQDGAHINEIYASALGDFRVWYRYAGISTDSYAASRGADGAFTGAVTYDGHPLFFRESGVEKVYPSSSGAHQIVWSPLDGVQAGCADSLRRCGTLLYYKARRGVMAYDGSLPAVISDALGQVVYSGASAGVLGGRYYISMQAAGGSWHLFCYDTENALWWREDGTRAELFVRMDGTLAFRRADDLRMVAVAAADGTEDAALHWYEDPEPLRWSAETGNIGMQYGGKKYLSRFDFRMELAPGARMQVEVQFDSSGAWEPRGTVQGQGLRTFVLPVRGRRCDHMRIRLSGVGACRIMSVTRTMEKGSDYGWR